MATHAHGPTTDPEFGNRLSQAKQNAAIVLGLEEFLDPRNSNKWSERSYLRLKGPIELIPDIYSLGNALLKNDPQLRYKPKLSSELTIEELRQKALADYKEFLPIVMRTVKTRPSSAWIRAYVRRRSNGMCEAEVEYCANNFAPFAVQLGLTYVDTHHIVGRAANGPDSIFNVVALCPDCHRRTEVGVDATEFNEHLLVIVANKECR